MIKKLPLFAIALLFAVNFTFNSCKPSQNKPQKAKYVFYFIGDGMGYQQITVAQAYLAAINDTVGLKNLSFTKFPVTGISSTYSYSRYITDSAAAGTALSTGSKTTPGTLGLGYITTDTLYSIASKANAAGFSVGLATSVSIDHATPAAFYAHQQSRNMYHRISHDLLASKYRFFASGGFMDPQGKKCKTPMGCVFEKGKSQGFYFTNTTALPDSVLNAFSSIVFSSPSPTHEASLKYQIDANEDDVKLEDITRMGIDILRKSKSFFFMVEGGKIDWACHDNDAATVIHDVVAFSDAVQIALDFYINHPNETLIVVTADHETGGLSLGNKSYHYNTNITLLAKQKMSLKNLSDSIKKFVNQPGKKPNYSQTIDFISSKIGYDFISSNLSKENVQILKAAYNESVLAPLTSEQKKANKSKYGSNEPLAVVSIQILNQLAGIGWTSTSHTGSHVPVYAIGAGQNLFSGQMDNTDIPKRIAKAMGIND
jgi:alkaline phosphatase